MSKKSRPENGQKKGKKRKSASRTEGEREVFPYGVNNERWKAKANKEELRLVESQIFYGSLYYNKRVEIERKRRDRYRALRRSLSDKLPPLLDAYEANEALIKAAVKRLGEIRDPENPAICLSRSKREENAEAQAIEEEIEALQDKSKELWAPVGEELRVVEETHFGEQDAQFHREKLRRYLARAIQKKPELSQWSNLPSDEDADEYYAELYEVLKKARLPGPRPREKIVEQLRREIVADAQQPEAWRAKVQIELDADVEMKKARLESGCFTGVYQKVQDATKQSFQNSPYQPKFSKFRREGKVSRQLTPALPVEKVLSGESPRLQITFTDEPVRGCRPISTLVHSMPGASPAEVVAEAKRRGISLSRKHPDRHPVTEELVAQIQQQPPPINKEPYRRAAIVRIELARGIYIHVPIVMHRPLPKGGKIQWVELVLHRVGYRDVYEIQFNMGGDLTKESRPLVCGEPRPEKRVDAIAINQGWRILQDREHDGDILVATTWDGQTSEQVILPVKFLHRRDTFRRLIKYTDQHFDAARKVLLPWAKGHKSDKAFAAPTEKDPDRTLLDNIHAWRDHIKLLKVANAMHRVYLSDGFVRDLWRQWVQERRSGTTKQERLSNPEKYDLFGTFDFLSGWFRKQGVTNSDEILALYLVWWGRKETHLTNCARAMEKKLKRARREIYRCAAALWASRYEHVVVGAWDGAELAKKPSPKKDRTTKKDDHANAIRQFCGTSVLVESLERAFGPKRYHKVSAEGATTTHFGCGGKGVKDSLTQNIRCSACGGNYDQDQNNAKNLLARYYEQSGGVETPPPARNAETPKRSSRSKKSRQSGELVERGAEALGA